MSATNPKSFSFGEKVGIVCLAIGMIVSAILSIAFLFDQSQWIRAIGFAIATVAFWFGVVRLAAGRRILPAFKWSSEPVAQADDTSIWDKFWKAITIPTPVLVMFMVYKLFLEKPRLEKAKRDAAFASLKLDGSRSALKDYYNSTPGEQLALRLDLALKAASTEKYWKDCVIQTFADESATQATAETVAAWLDEFIEDGKSEVVRVRSQSTKDVDPDLVRAVSAVLSPMDRYLNWLDRHRALLIKLNEGRTPEEISQEADSVIDRLYEIPDSTLPPELEEFRQAVFDLDEATEKLDEMRIRLSERYKDRNFPPF